MQNLLTIALSRLKLQKGKTFCTLSIDKRIRVGRSVVVTEWQNCVYA